ncbi:MAG: hypothetical protein KC502_13465 [Myxococcales bacterium]|nr:hypothetical protein [Myxococcales bacterium]
MMNWQHAPKLGPKLTRTLMQRASWWHDTGLLYLCPTEAQLTAALQPFRPTLRRPTGVDNQLPWLGLPLPTTVLRRLLRSNLPVDKLWIAQLLRSEPDVLRACGRADAKVAAIIDEAKALSTASGLPLFLHRAAQIPLADLAWFATNDVRTPHPGRCWPPADDLFPAEVHGQRTVRALVGLPQLGA